MKKATTVLSEETQRIDVLLAKWGILIGNLGDNRPRRRKLALVLAQDYSGKVTEQVLKTFLDEGKTQGVKSVVSWMVAILEDEVERRAYLPEILRMSEEEAKHEPGDTKVLEAGSRAEMERRAAQSGKTISEETFLARRAYMWARHWGDGYSIEQVAKEQGIDVQTCRYEISKEVETQLGLTLDEWEAAKKTSRERARAARLAPRKPETQPIRRSQVIAELDDRIAQAEPKTPRKTSEEKRRDFMEAPEQGLEDLRGDPQPPEG